MPEASPQARVLLADDDRAVRLAMASVLEDAGFQVDEAEDGSAALARFEAQPHDVVVSDINMPGLDGLALLDRIKALAPEQPVVFVTAYAAVDTAIAALRKGAFDYVTKPFRNEQLVATVRNAHRLRMLFAENRTLLREIERGQAFSGMVGRSPAMTAVLRLVERAASSQAAILIRGETGTGKELVARAVHRASSRATGPFVGVNCAALPEGLLESELFGHERGAFSGAVARHEGLLRAAHGGTLFLDELGDMPLEVQAKLLRVLEEREVRPVGSTRTHPVDVRLVCATHRDLNAAVADGSFREDLYYRCAVIELELPPLRERPDDVLPLFRHFLQAQSEESGRELSLSAAAAEALQRYPWPGNVRELRNAVEHLAALCDGEIAPNDLPTRIRQHPSGSGAHDPARRHPHGIDAARDLASVERAHIQRILREEGGDRRQAARVLGIDLSTLYRKLKRWEDTADSAP